jgi:hypothetical protein
LALLADVAGAGEAVTPLQKLLETAGRYVVGYEATFSHVTAEETYMQWVGEAGETGRKRQLTRADLVFVSIPGTIPWTTFRDVYEVDGQQLHERDSRLEALLLGPTDTLRQRAGALVRESARYNIGPATRTINVPTLPLLFLHPRNQGRFRFSIKGRRYFHDLQGVEVDFTETSTPTLVGDGDGGDLPSRGRFWVNPDRGVVLRSETVFRFEPGRATASVSTDYRPEAGLGIFVPAEMKERYVDLPGGDSPIFGTLVEGTARYDRYRRFSVSTEEDVAVPPAEDPAAPKP